MKIGIIDAEIINNKKHRFPNLACMKLSSYYKSLGNEVNLLMSYDIDEYDMVFISKVFIKTDIPMEDRSIKKTELNCAEYYANNKFLKNPKIAYGGTGFFYEKAPKLPNEIEHCMPDYHLYDEWVKQCVQNGANPKDFSYYTDYSIGFLTRGCFRKCQLCVNKVYDRCCAHSNLSEFIDNNRKKLCFLDDNFFACPNWKEIIEEVKLTKNPFQFKQGLDERLLTKEKIAEINNWKYVSDMIFAFDNIEDKDLIVSKLNLIYSTCPDWKKSLKFYCFCGFDRNNKYDIDFWKKDVIDLFERIFILSKYSALPYVMRHENYKNFVCPGIYDTIAAWCNQPSLFKTFTFEEFCKCRGMKGDGYKKYKRNIDGYITEYGEDAKGASWRYYDMLVDLVGDMKYFHITPRNVAKYGRDAKCLIGS